MNKVEERDPILIENQGEKIFAVIHRPLNAINTPAVLISPGFAGTKCGKFRMFVRLAEKLAAEGMTVLRFDYRGAGDSEGDFQDITLKGKVSDVICCLEYLCRDPKVDSSRIGLLGRSLGGAIAVLAAKQFGHIKSLALWAPVFTSDPWKDQWKLYQQEHPSASKNPRSFELPANVPNLEFLKQFFLLDVAKELEALKNVPLLHIHGSKDLIVKPEHAQAYKNARNGANLTTFMELPLSDHDFSEPKELEKTLEETIKWFKMTL